jgi:uncharacterized membrane protein
MSGIAPHRSSLWLSAALIASALLAPPVSSAQTLYRIAELVTPPGSAGSAAVALNDAGDVVGSYSPASEPGPVACAWRNGAMSRLGKLAGGNYSQATAINSLGVVVGDGDTGNFRPQSWVTTPSGLYNFFPNNGGNTHVVGVNDGGAIGGYYTKSLSGWVSSWRGSIWTPDPKDPRKYRQVDLPRLIGLDPNFNGTAALPMAFNQSGEAAGYAQNEVIGQHACLWNNDAAHSIVDLGVYPGDWSSLGWGINDLGLVVGESHPPFGSRPVVWGNDASHTPVELPLLPGDNYGAATAINNLGQILGSSAASVPGTWDVGPSRPVIWRDGGVFELRFLLDASGAGWTLTSAGAINNRGQIVGVGLHNGQPRAFLMTPISP